MADFSELEAREGVRLSWNVWPSSRLEANRVAGMPTHTPRALLDTLMCPRTPERAHTTLCPLCSAIWCVVHPDEGVGEHQRLTVAVVRRWRV